MMLRSRISVCAAAILAVSIPAMGGALAEKTLFWSERSNGALTMLTYGSLDQLENPLFMLSCFSGMDVAVLDVHQEISGVEPGEPVLIEISSETGKSPVQGEVARNEDTGSTYAEASDIDVKPVLDMLREPGPVTLTMGASSATLSDVGRADAVSKFSENCKLAQG